MLYVFGDSFSHDISHMEISNTDRLKRKIKFPTFIPLENNWTNILSKRLTGSTVHVNESMAGCANEYIYHKLITNYEKFKAGDHVVVCLTAENRRWLVERCPHLANWAMCDFEPDVPGSVTKEENHAIGQYARYLHSDLAAGSIYNAIIWATVYAARSVEHLGVKFLILPGFHEINGVKGTLNDASTSEFDSIETLQKFYRKTNDTRWNHFSEKNHEILADKVYNFFTDFTDVDLTTGFETNIYTKKNI